MENSGLIKYNSGLLKTVSNSISVTNKLLANIPPQLIPYRKGDKWGYCTSDKNLVIACNYQRTNLFANGLSNVKVNNKWGFINTKAEVVIPCVYEEVNPFWDDHYNQSVVTLNKKKGTINKFGEIAIPIEYDEISFYGEGPFAAKKKDRWGYINVNGDFVINFIFRDASSFSEGISFVVFENWKTGFIDKKGKLVVDLNETKTGRFFAEGLLSFLNVTNDEYNGKWGFYDRNKNIVIKPIYDEVKVFGEGLAGVKIKNKWGFIDRNGSMVVKPTYNYVGDFNENLCDVNLNNKHGFINSKGEIGIGLKYDNVFHFFDGYALVILNDKSAIIDRNGKTIFPFEFTLLFYPFNLGVFEVYDKSVLGYVNFDGIRYWED